MHDSCPGDPRNSLKPGLLAHLTAVHMPSACYPGHFSKIVHLVERILGTLPRPDHTILPMLMQLQEAAPLVNAAAAKTK